MNRSPRGEASATMRRPAISPDRNDIRHYFDRLIKSTPVPRPTPRHGSALLAAKRGAIAIVVAGVVAAGVAVFLPDLVGHAGSKTAAVTLPAGGPSLPRTTVPTGPTCRTDQLTGASAPVSSLLATPKGSSSHVDLSGLSAFRLTNQSRVSCLVDLPPRVSFTSASGVVVAPASVKSMVGSLELLRPDQATNFVVEYNNQAYDCKGSSEEDLDAVRVDLLAGKVYFHLSSGLMIRRSCTVRIVGLGTTTRGHASGSAEGATQG
jgi:hypothetical protein